MPIEGVVHFKGSWKAKLARATVRSRLATAWHGWGFAAIYLLYPATSAAVLQSFYCRTLTAGGLSVLMADVSVRCTNEGGALDPAYLPLLVAGALLFLLWSVGVPLTFALLLFKHRRAIASNPFYAEIAFLRPLFIFMKADCYMWEVYFMLEKLLLVGLVSALRVYIGGFFLVNLVSLAITITVLCCLVRARPSRTEPYNTANIVSHGLILVALLASAALKHPQPEDGWASPEVVGLVLTALQVPFWLYLIKVSTGKLRLMCHQSRQEVGAQMRSERAVRDHHAAVRRGTLSLSLVKARGLSLPASRADKHGVVGGALGLPDAAGGGGRAGVVGGSLFAVARCQGQEDTTLPVGCTPVAWGEMEAPPPGCTAELAAEWGHDTTPFYNCTQRSVLKVSVFFRPDRPPADRGGRPPRARLLGEVKTELHAIAPPPRVPAAAAALPEAEAGLLRAALAELEGGGEETEPVAVDTKEAAAQLRAKLGSPSLSERATALVARLEGTPHLDGRLDLSEFGVGEALAGPRNELWLPLGGGAGRGYQVGLGGGADAGGPELLVVAQFVHDRPWPRPARRGGGGLLDIYSRFGKSDRQVRGDSGDGDHPALARLVVDVKVSPPTPASHNVIQSRTAQS
jgi:hypothetical protein